MMTCCRIVCAMVVFLAGCGYTTSSVVLQGARTIYVENFVNMIDFTDEVTDRRMNIAYRSGMELDITRAIIDRFIQDGTLRIVRKENADILVTGELTAFQKEALRFDDADNVLEFRVKVLVDLVLVDSSDGSVLMTQKNFTGETIYRTQGGSSLSEAQANQQAIDDLAVRVVDLVVEGW